MHINVCMFILMHMWYIYIICIMGLHCGSTGKESACNVRDLGLIPGLAKFPGEGNSSPLQSSGLENSMDCIVHGVAKSWTLLSNFRFHTYIMSTYLLEMYSLF